MTDKFPDKINKYLLELGYNKKQISRINLNLKCLEKRRGNNQMASMLRRKISNGSPIFTVYPDQLVNGKHTINNVNEFMCKYFPQLPVYLLPCWEDTGDGGFSIKNFKKPRKEVGTISELKDFFSKRP